MQVAAVDCVGAPLKRLLGGRLLCIRLAAANAEELTARVSGDCVILQV